MTFYSIVTLSATAASTVVCAIAAMPVIAAARDLSGWPIDKTPNPSMLQVDYVKAFSKK